MSILRRSSCVLVVALMFTSCGQKEIAPPDVSELKEARIEEDTGFWYVVRPLRDLWGVGTPSRVVNQAVDLLVKKAGDRVKPVSEEDATISVDQMIDYLKTENDEAAMKKTLNDARWWIKKASQSAADVGIQISDLVPSGLLVLGQFNAEGNKFLAYGGSGTVAIVLVPMLITRISKYPDMQGNIEKITYPSVSVAVSFIGVANLGIGVNSSVVEKSYGFGLGVVFGGLDKAQDFQGYTVGVATAVSTGGLGKDVKVMCIVGGNSCKNIYTTFSWNNQVVPSFKWKASGAGGKIIPLSQYIDTSDFEGMISASPNGTDPVHKATPVPRGRGFAPTEPAKTQPQGQTLPKSMEFINLDPPSGDYY